MKNRICSFLGCNKFCLSLTLPCLAIRQLLLQAGLVAHEGRSSFLPPCPLLPRETWHLNWEQINQMLTCVLCEARICKQLPWKQRGAHSCFTEGHGCQQEEQERGVHLGFPVCEAAGPPVLFWLQKEHCSHLGGSFSIVLGIHFILKQYRLSKIHFFSME